MNRIDEHKKKYYNLLESVWRRLRKVMELSVALAEPEQTGIEDRIFGIGW